MTVELYHPEDHLIHAIDVMSEDEFLDRLGLIQGLVNWVKLGQKTFAAVPDAVGTAIKRGFQVMLDLKFHDIPSQIGDAGELWARRGVSMMTVHTAGGAQMLQAAMDGAKRGNPEKPPLIYAITMLTSLDQKDLPEIGVELSPAKYVDWLVGTAELYVDGIVCSPDETAMVHGRYPNLGILNPGINAPDGTSAFDQARTGSPDQAIRDGADFLVVGRGITRGGNVPERIKEFHRAINTGYFERQA